MATPCNSQLQKAPFNTYRDPQTGEWKLEHRHTTPAAHGGNVIPFRRLADSLPLIINQAK